MLLNGLILVIVAKGNWYFDSFKGVRNTWIHLRWEYPPGTVGGIANHVHDLTKEMSARGVSVSILTCLGKWTD